MHNSTLKFLTQIESTSNFSNPLTRLLLYGRPGRLFLFFNTIIKFFLSKFLPSKLLENAERLIISNGLTTQFFPTCALSTETFSINSILFRIFDALILATPLAPLWMIIKIACPFVRCPVIWAINSTINTKRRYALGQHAFLYHLANKTCIHCK
jgi:hypothetical protein